MLTPKQAAICRIAIFMSDRVDHTLMTFLRTRDSETSKRQGSTREEDIQRLLEQELEVWNET